MRFPKAAVAILTVSVILTLSPSVLEFPSSSAGTVVSGTISADTVWNSSGSPYWIVDNVTVSSGATLTVQQDVEVLFDGQYNIVVFGNMSAAGEAGNETTFDANFSALPQESVWRIDVRPGASLHVSHSRMRHGKMTLQQSDGFVLEGSEVFDSTTPVYVSGSQDVSISGNHFYDNKNAAIRVTGQSRNGTIDLNIFEDHPDVAVRIDFAGDWTIRNNTIRNAGTGLWISTSAEDAIAIQNEISQCGSGIVVGTIYGVSMLENYVHDNVNGMIVNSFGMTIEGNTLRHNSKNNMVVKMGSGNVSRNHITDGYRGILAEGASSVQFFNNYVANNDIGMDHWNSSRHIIHHNYFDSNTLQAQVNRIISPFVNFWNETYPSGGNYWSDYTGTDVYNGPNQNIPGSDGIGDQNYTIPEANNDSYPLMSPPFELIPDLQISSADIRFIPESPVTPATMVAINITVWNEGWDDAQDVSVSVYMGHPDNHMLIGGGTIPQIAPMGWREFLEKDWPPPSPGDYEIWVVLDENDLIAESNESNNEAFGAITVEWPSPFDLRVDPSYISFDPPGPVDNGTLLNISATVFNDGSVDALDVLVRFYDNAIQPANQIGGDVVMPIIPVGSSEVATVQWTASPPGSHNIWVYADPLDSIQEVDEFNNQAYSSIEVLSTSLLRPPTMNEAVLAGAFLEDVLVSWELSPDDANGSVARYDIYRGTVFSPGGSGYVLHDSVPSGTSSYLDMGAGEGDPDIYFYRVCAVDPGNSSACAEDQAGKFTRPLAQGPNLVSIPLIQSNESIERVLQTVKYDRAWYYDSSSQEWKWYVTSKAYRRGLWSVNHTVGLWANVTEDCNLTVAGIVPAQTTIRLHEGWNLVSFPSFKTTYSVADLKAENSATRVEGYNLAPPCYLRVFGDAEVLQAGYGYWMRVDAVTDWIVQVS